MTSTPESLEGRWRALIAEGGPAMREVNAQSPLRMVVGVNELSRPYFFVVVHDKPGIPQLSAVITVERRQRSVDSQWTLTLQLGNTSLTDAFVSLVSEVADKSASEPTESAAMSVFLETLADWQQLLLARHERLSEEALRGLIAELWFGFESGVHGQPLDAAVRAWSGPMGGEQDYNFPSPAKQFEVKSIRPARNSVEISSAEQLDRDDVCLAVVTMEDLASNAAGVTLPDLVAGIRTRLIEPSVRADFNRRFARLFLDLDDPWYREQIFLVQRLRVYEVADQFPALRRSELPPAVARTKYRIDLHFIPEFLIIDQAFDTSERANA
jgi:Putative  PD-(D/E)XK family member, (DUF4420)